MGSSLSPGMEPPCKPHRGWHSLVSSLCSGIAARGLPETTQKPTLVCTNPLSSVSTLGKVCLARDEVAGHCSAGMLGHADISLSQQPLPPTQTEFRPRSPSSSREWELSVGRTILGVGFGPMVKLDPAGRGLEVVKPDQHHGLVGLRALLKTLLRETTKAQLKWPQLVSSTLLAAHGESPNEASAPSPCGMMENPGAHRIPLGSSTRLSLKPDTFLAVCPASCFGLTQEMQLQAAVL